jgi:N-methylhydantoinase A
MSYRIGVDIGGTFTDFVLVDEQTGEVSTAKTPTTPDDQSKGFINAIDLSPVPVSDVDLVLHGCTVGLNAILTRRGAKVGLIVTDGFRDVTAMGRGQRPGTDQFNPRYTHSFGDSGQPFVPRYLRRGVVERMSARGEPLVGLDAASVRREVVFLKAQGVEAIAICFLNSYINDAHERAAKQIVHELWPEVACWTSTEVHPCFKEYPRFSTCVLNSYIGPLLDRYLDRAETMLRERNYHRPLLIMQSNGGVLTASMTRQRPAYTAQSGPTGGVIAASYWGKQLGVDNLLTLDIGGTSADYSIIQQGRPLVTTELELEHDVVIALPALNVYSIGAGGGSIAWIDSIGALRVGPQSAGSVPGPACYGRGGKSPTVTDALLIAGFLRAEDFLAGKMPLDIEASRRSLEAIAAALGCSVERAAEAVLNVATANIVEGAREMAVFNGVDPRDYTLYAFGSAGPVFASAIGRELGVKDIAIPPTPGEMCAFGLAMADLRVDVGDPLVKPLNEVPADQLEKMYASLEQRARDVMASGREGHSPGNISVLRWLDGRYVGQTWETPSVPVPAVIDADTFAQIKHNFDETHKRLWGYSLKSGTVKASMVRVTLVVAFPPVVAAAKQAGDGQVQRAQSGTTRVHFKGEWVDVPVFHREELFAGDEITGPALINQATSSTVLLPGDKAHCDGFGHLWINWQ